MSKRRCRSSHGFTLIELIVVIVILGVLAATALPKFMDMRSDANKAALAGLEATIKSAMNIGHAKCVMMPGCYVAGSQNITVDGATRRYLNAYPDGGENFGTGIEMWFTVSSEVSRVHLSFTTIRWQINGAPTPASCYVQFVEAASFGAAPQISTVTTGC